MNFCRGKDSCVHKFYLGGKLVQYLDIIKLKRVIMRQIIETYMYILAEIEFLFQQFRNFWVRHLHDYILHLLSNFYGSILHSYTVHSYTHDNFILLCAVLAIKLCIGLIMELFSTSLGDFGPLSMVLGQLDLTVQCYDPTL